MTHTIIIQVNTIKTVLDNRSSWVRVAWLGLKGKGGSTKGSTGRPATFRVKMGKIMPNARIFYRVLLCTADCLESLEYHQKWTLHPFLDPKDRNKTQSLMLRRKTNTNTKRLFHTLAPREETARGRHCYFSAQRGETPMTLRMPGKVLCLQEGVPL